jgi:hypothetical protein
VCCVTSAACAWRDCARGSWRVETSSTSRACTTHLRDMTRHTHSASVSAHCADGRRLGVRTLEHTAVSRIADTRVNAPTAKHVSQKGSERTSHHKGYTHVEDALTATRHGQLPRARQPTRAQYPAGGILPYRAPIPRSRFPCSWRVLTTVRQCGCGSRWTKGFPTR